MFIASKELIIIDADLKIQTRTTYIDMQKKEKTILFSQHRKLKKNLRKVYDGATYA